MTGPMRGAEARPTFVFTYRMPTGYVPAGPETTAPWAAWFDSMGESLSDRGNAVFEAAELGNCREDTQLGGYTFVNAEDLESAVALAEGSPALKAGGGVEVGGVAMLDLDSSSSGRG
jgi:hypothetical protein